MYTRILIHDAKGISLVPFRCLANDDFKNVQVKYAHGIEGGVVGRPEQNFRIKIRKSQDRILTRVHLKCNETRPSKHCTRGKIPPIRSIEREERPCVTIADFIGAHDQD